MNKNKFFGRGPAIILAIVMIFTLLPGMAMADETSVIETQTEEISLPNTVETQTEEIGLPDTVETQTEEISLPDTVETQTEDAGLPDASEPQDGDIELLDGEVTGITVSPASLNMRTGDTQTLTATVSPSDSTETVVWSSDNESVATVDQSGNVTAVSSGSATITATAGGMSATASVLVYRIVYSWYTDFDDKVHCGATGIAGSVTIYEDGSVSSVVTKAATCTKAGLITYTATFNDALFETQTSTDSIPALGHNFQFKDIIPATQSSKGYIERVCSRCGAISKTTIFRIKSVKLAKTKMVYNGKAQKPAVTVTDGKGNVIPSIYYTVKYSKGCKNVGTYTATITFKNSYSGTVTKNFKIVKATPKIKIKKKTTTYNGSVQTIDKAVVTGSKGKVVYYYFTDSACKKKTTRTANGSSSTGGAPKYAGKYYVKAKVLAKGNYKAVVSKAVRFTIKKASSTITLQGRTANYAGYPIAVADAQVSGSTGTVKYFYFTDSACTTKTTSANGAASTGGAPANAGTYYVKAKVYADKNYKAAVSAPVKLVIKKLSSTISITNKSEQYNGSVISVDTPQVTGSNGAVTITYYTDSSCTTKTTTANGATQTGGAPANAGTYYAKARVAASTNYKAAVSGVAVLTITKAASKISFKGETVAYTGKVIKITPAVISGSTSTDIYYRYYTSSSCDVSKQTTYENSGSLVQGGPPSKRGVYYVKVTVTGDANYNTTISAPVAFVIK